MRSFLPNRHLDADLAQVALNYKVIDSGQNRPFDLKAEQPFIAPETAVCPDARWLELREALAKQDRILGAAKMNLTI